MTAPPAQSPACLQRSESAAELDERMAWQQIKRMTPYLSATPSGNLAPCLSNPNYFYCLISRGVCGVTHNQMSLLLLALSLAVGFSATLLTSSPVNQIIAHVIPEHYSRLCRCKRLDIPIFRGLYAKQERHQPFLSCFLPVFLFPGDNSFISGSPTEKSAIQLHYIFGL